MINVSKLIYDEIMLYEENLNYEIISDLDLFYAVSIETAFGGRIMLQGKISSDSIEVANKLNVPLVFHNGRGWLEGEAEGINITLCK